MAKPKASTREIESPAQAAGPSSGPVSSRRASGAVSRLEPGPLAELLDRWALRREKVLAVIDVKAARRARRLAQACRALHARGVRGVDVEQRRALELEWLELREEVAALLAHGSDPA